MEWNEKKTMLGERRRGECERGDGMREDCWESFGAREHSPPPRNLCQTELLSTPEPQTLAFKVGKDVQCSAQRSK